MIKTLQQFQAGRQTMSENQFIHFSCLHDFIEISGNHRTKSIKNTFASNRKISSIILSTSIQKPGSLETIR